MGYNYKIEYKKGKENKATDALFRVELNTTLHAIFVIIPTWIEQVIDSYKIDPFCLELITKLSLDTNAIPNYTLASGVLRYKGRVLIGQDESLRN